MRHGEVSTKTLENRTLLSGWLDEGTLRPVSGFLRKRIAPSGGGRMYTGGDWTPEMGIPDKLR